MSLYRTIRAERLWAKLATVFTLGLLVSISSLAHAQTTDPKLQDKLGNPSGATFDVANPNNYLLEKNQYTLSYNNSHKTPNWVSWHLGPSDLGTTKRQDSFSPDDALPPSWYHVKTGDYTNGGYDRGHNCPSGDRTASVANNDATFLMDNIVPQEADNNQGPWEVFEDYCRNLVKTNGNELFIISCPNTYNRTTIGTAKIYVPRYMSKVVVVLPKGSSLSASSVTTATRVICIDMPNIPGIRSDDWQDYRISVDDLEAYTGYDFLSNVPANIQAVIEAKVDNQ